MNDKPIFKNNKIILTSLSGLIYYFYLISLNRISKNLLTPTKRGIKFFIDNENDQMLVVRRKIEKRIKTPSEKHKISALLPATKIPSNFKRNDSAKIKN